MKNKLKINSEQGETLYAYLYMGYYDRPVVSFQTTPHPDWSPNPFCYDFDTFLNLDKGLLIDSHMNRRTSISLSTILQIKSFIKNYKGEYLKSYLRSEVK